MARLRPRNIPLFSGFTNAKSEKMEKFLMESGALALGREFCQMIAIAFNRSAGHAGKPAVKWIEIQSWFQTRLQVPQEVPKDLECKAGKKIQNSSEIEFEARSSIDGAEPKEEDHLPFLNPPKKSTLSELYDVEKFLGHRFLSTGEAEVHIRFAGFGAEENEWVNIRSALRERSVTLESTESCELKVGDQVLCFQERRDQAIHYDAHIMEIQRRMHDIRGCRCPFSIRYDHDNSEESVHLRRMCRRARS